MPEEIITKVTVTEGKQDLSGPDYSVKFEGNQQPLVGVEFKQAYVDASTNPFNNVNIDQGDPVAVAQLYNKHKSVWDAQYNPTGNPSYQFNPSPENAKALVQIVNLHLYYKSMEVTSNVTYDPITGGYSVPPEQHEYDRTPSYNWAQDQEHRYPNARPYSEEVRRDSDGRLLNASGNLYYDFDVTDRLASVTAYRNHKRAWEASYPGTLFNYSEAEAIKLKNAINKNSAPYSALAPDSDRTIGSTMVYNKYISAITTEERKQMPEYLVTLHNPDIKVDNVTGKIYGLTDWGSPYANSPHFPPATPDNSDHS